MKREVKGIYIFPAPGKVGIVFEYVEGPAEPYLLSLHVAQQFRDKLVETCNKVAAAAVPGDAVGVQEHVEMRILPPRSH